MRKCKCGNPVANNAKACPKCGHRFTSGPVLVLAWFFGVVIVVAFVGAITGSNNGTSQPAPSPAEQAASTKAQTSKKDVSKVPPASAQPKQNENQPDLDTRTAAFMAASRLRKSM